MVLNRRQFLGGLFASTTGKLPIGNLPQQVLDVLDIPKFPIDITGASREQFLKTIKKSLGDLSNSGVTQETIDIFLNERDKLAEKTCDIGQRLLKGLGVDSSTSNKIRVHKKVPHHNTDNPTQILNRWGYPEMTWEDFFQWEGRHTVEGSYPLETGISLPCSEEGVEADGNITLDFNSDGLIKLILHLKKKTGSMSSSSTQGIEIIVKNVGEIHKQIFDWKTKDWSQAIIREHEEARKKLGENLKKINEQERQKRENRNMNILKGSTALISPEQTFKLNKKTKSTLLEAPKRVGEIMPQGNIFENGIDINRQTQYYLREHPNKSLLFYS